MTLALPLPSPREVRTARLATLGSTARATVVTTVEYASSASWSSGRRSSAITQLAPVGQRLCRGSPPAELSRENHLACDDGGGHHLCVEFVERLGGRRGQHTKVAGLARRNGAHIGGLA